MLSSTSVTVGRRIEIEGIVQGVGFRPWVYRLAHELRLNGRVRNVPGQVVIEAFGEADALDRFLDRLGAEAPPAASIRRLDWRRIPPTDERGFRIESSQSEGQHRVAIPADLATCSECVADIFDPRNRRYRYPFTNCTNCGPRFTIARGVPYDRARTTMAPFRMCAACRAEYDDPANRRFHAEPNACPACGPRLRLLLGEGDPLAAACATLRGGGIVALKGIGGFHLACDARSPEAVQRLRSRKGREEKPFAVMVRDVEAALALATVSLEEAALLASVERPIVLLDARPGAQLAAEVAPRLPQLGLMLPYTPLHHLLLADFAGPLVMTSGNVSDEPIAYRDDEALQRLGGIADLFVLHDREIDARCDDSVARVIRKAPLCIRRSRGFVPRVVPLANPVARPVLAVGAQLKNAICLASGSEAVLGPHVGDLDGPEAFAAFNESIERMQRFLGVRPEIVAHDLHPDYLSTRYALELGLPAFAVQHHHAHVASAMAEHGLEGPVIGVAFDGTGLGDDGSLWGGEFLLARKNDFRRVATMRPIPLAGGEKAIREVWRLALAVVKDAFGEGAPLDRFALFQNLPRDRVQLVERMLDSNLNCPRSHGVGRLFDAIGALALSRPLSSYEGQVALEWNLAAGVRRSAIAPYTLHLEKEPWQLDLRPLTRAVALGLLAGAPAADLSALFHDTLADATAQVVREMAARFGALPVVLTGGCFQNRRLAESVAAALDGFDLRLHREVPCGDGGIALGQAFVAAARS